MAEWLRKARSNGRRRARNNVSKEAQKRLDETIAPFHEQAENALQVDGTKAIMFHKCETGRPCTCSHTPVVDEMDGNNTNQSEDPDLVSGGTESDGINFEMVDDDDVFGEHGQQAAEHGRNQSEFQRQQGDEIEAGDLILSGDGGYDQVGDQDRVISAFEDGLFSGSSINCGICYSRGITPPYNPTNFNMAVLTNYNIEDYEGYHIDFTKKPAQMQPTDRNSWLKFSIIVPKYFKMAKYSIRDNLDIIQGAELYMDSAGTTALSKRHLEAARGKAIDIYVLGENFTHVSMFFEQNSDPLLVNVSDEQETLDYTRSSTIGQLNIIAPARIGMVRNSDVIVLPERDLVLKINDAPRKATSQRTIIEWMLTCRALQGSEALTNIYDGRKVY